MLYHPVRTASRHADFRETRRFQIGFGLLPCVLLPWLLRVGIDPALLDVNTVRNTALACLAAFVAGSYTHRSLTTFPGIRASYYILPSFALAYSLPPLFFILARLDYSRFVFVASFLLSLIWFYALFFLNQRSRVLLIGVVPFGDVEVPVARGINWHRLIAPRQPAAADCNALVADFRADLPDEWERFLADAALSGVTVYHIKELRESLTGRVQIEHLSENNFGSLIPTHAYLTLKGVLDFLASVVATALLLPVFVIIAVLIKRDSPGPIFFRQRRVGYGGGVFRVFKFRTMVHRPEPTEDGRRHAITRENDERITRIGRVLRRYRLDELPQVLNVLRGEMSWIGPRPEAEVLSKWYEQELPFYRYRHIVKPGISGWAQVNQGHVAEVEDVLWKLQFDFYYIKNFSLWLDTLIAIRTVITLLTGFGSR